MKPTKPIKYNHKSNHPHFLFRKKNNKKRSPSEVKAFMNGGTFKYDKQVEEMTYWINCVDEYFPDHEMTLFLTAQPKEEV